MYYHDGIRICITNLSQKPGSSIDNELSLVDKRRDITQQRSIENDFDDL